MTRTSKGNERMVEVRRVYAYPTGHDAGYPGVAPECLACTAAGNAVRTEPASGDSMSNRIRLRLPGTIHYE